MYCQARIHHHHNIDGTKVAREEVQHFGGRSRLARGIVLHTLWKL